MIKVITYGTYDLLHYGHIRLLERAKALGDYLIVGVTADDFDKNRGKINVQQSLSERIAAVRDTGLADEIIVEEYEGQKIDDIRRLDVDIFTVGSDWVGYFDYLKEYCKVVYLERTKGISSSELREEKRSIHLGLVGNSSFLNKVKDEAEVYGDAEVCDNAEIRDNAEILGDARIGGKAQIYGKAKVMRGVVVHANAEILGDAQIQGVVNISQDARICSDEDYAAVQGFRTKFKFATFYRAKDEKVMVYCGDFNGNLEGFREWAKKTFDGKNQKEYLTIADFMEQHFAPE